MRRRQPGWPTVEGAGDKEEVASRPMGRRGSSDRMCMGSDAWQGEMGRGAGEVKPSPCGCQTWRRGEMRGRDE